MDLLPNCHLTFCSILKRVFVCVYKITLGNKSVYPSLLVKIVDLFFIRKKTGRLRPPQDVSYFILEYIEIK